VITRGAIVSRPLNELLEKAAESVGIECTTEAAGSSTGTDADVVHMSRTGVPTAVVSIPLRYMHSPVELVELGDVAATIEVIAAMALRLEADKPLTRW
jgi:endoglucanase